MLKEEIVEGSLKELELSTAIFSGLIPSTLVVTGLTGVAVEIKFATFTGDATTGATFTGDATKGDNSNGVLFLVLVLLCKIVEILFVVLDTVGISNNDINSLDFGFDLTFTLSIIFFFQLTFFL